MEVDLPITMRDALLIERMAVLPASYPDMIFTAEETKKMEERILELIDLMDEKEEVPQFLYRRFENGYWKVACFGESCRDWLVKEISTWEFKSSRLKVIPWKDLPRPPVYKVWIPGDMQFERFLTRLRKQNKNLNPDKWRLLHKIKTDTGYIIILEIDFEADKFLIQKNHLLFYGMTQIKFEIKSSSDKAVEEIDQGDMKPFEAVGETSSAAPRKTNST